MRVVGDGENVVAGAEEFQRDSHKLVILPAGGAAEGEGGSWLPSRDTQKYTGPSTSVCICACITCMQSLHA